MVSVAIAAPVTLRASDITYSVDDSVGTAGSVSGTITTDGSIGALSTGNIVGWDLNLNDGSGGTFELTTANSQEIISESDLVATATQLTYYYSYSDDAAFMIENATIGDGGPYVCWSSSSYCYDGFPGIFLAAENGEGDKILSLFPAEVSVIANVADSNPTTTPEPGSLLLFGTGIVSFAGVLRRKFARQAGQH
jgi:hypothetical protein